jgi:hypothetical protein
MFVTVVQLTALAGTLLAFVGQVDGLSAHESERSAGTSRASEQGYAEITIDGLEVYDQPAEGSFVVGALSRGDRVRVRESVAPGWLSIDPPPPTFCWIARTAIDFGANAGKKNGRVPGPTSVGRSRRSALATVVTPGAVFRFGHPRARMPGPTRGNLSAGTVVRLVDRPPLELGQGRSARVWYAIEPPRDQCCYIRAGRTRALRAAQHATEALQAAYVTVHHALSAPPGPGTENLPAAVASEIEKIEAIERSMITNYPIEDWRFESARSRFGAILKSAGDNPAVEEALRVRLARVTEYEQAAKAARQIRTILAESHARDREVAAVERRIAAAGRSHARAFQAVGYMQPSSHQVEGRKLYVLISNNGSTLAYLDIPPGLDPDPLLASRVGVRGVPHYNEDLGARLITVRDLEAIETRR